nr:PTS glucose transporter subunit IIA [Clostridium sp. AM58-1XD]
MNGEGFKCCVEDGQKVKTGDLLAEVDLAFVKEKGYNTITPILITNMDDVKNVKMVTGDAKAGETAVITYEK